MVLRGSSRPLVGPKKYPWSTASITARPSSGLIILANLFFIPQSIIFHTPLPQAENSLKPTTKTKKKGNETGSENEAADVGTRSNKLTTGSSAAAEGAL